MLGKRAVKGDVMRKRSNMVTSYMTCRECGKLFPIMRNVGYMRKKGHLKDMWCPYCMKEVKFIEKREFI